MNGAAARMKGIRWERACAQFYDLATTRSTRPGIHDDGGDLDTGGQGLVIECKDHGQWRVQHWFEQTEAKCREGERPLLLLKRRQRTTADGLVVVRMGDLDIRYV